MLVKEKIGENLSSFNLHSLINESNEFYQLSNDQLSTREADHSANNSSVAVNQANCEAKTSGLTKNFLTSLINESHLLYQLSDDELSKREAEHSANNSSLAAVNQANCESKASDVTKDFLASEKCENEQGTLKKLDSFGRWMNSEMGKDCEDLPVSSNSSIWKAIDPESEGKIISSFSSDMQLDIDSMDPSLPQVQLFSISDFSPDWAYSGVESKVLIIGQFLGITEPRKIKWSCMFGEVEVSAEFVANNVLKCMAPVHAPGRIPFYITCSNRSACSEIREFEYRENLSRFTSVGERNADEYSYLQLRLGKLLSMTMERKWLFCSVDICQKCVLKQQIFSLLKDDEKDWKKIEKHCEAFQQNRIKLRDSLLERMFKDKLYEWLVCRIHEEEKGPKIFDEEGQGVIHLAAALGYKWAINPIISSGVSPSFRDAHGRTSLHWAAYFGREETVMELVRLGAAPGAVEDPTSKYPQGQTAADLASSRGYKGIAGFLAELDLTSHLSTLTVDDDERAINKFSATLAAEEAIQTFQEQNTVSSKETEHQSLRHSLHAVRNSAQAAARIQASFRLNSFRHKKLIKNKAEDSDDLTDFMVLSSNKSHRIGHFNEFLHKAATRIQQNYRGWKGRNEFLKMRERIVKLQAHFRGHQVRKQYKKVVWSVGIVEKAILRWRRKGAGLRGFRAENSSAIEHKTEAVDEYDFLRIGRRQKAAVVEKALQRVQSMARHPEGRHQYMRLSEKFKQLKLGDVQSSDDRNRSSDQENSVEDRD